MKKGKKKSIHFVVMKRFDGYQAVIKHVEGFTAVIGPMGSKSEAQHFLDLSAHCYKLGRMDEFKDNQEKTHKLMEKFGL